MTLCDGLTYYLPPEANQQIFARVASLTAPGSSIVFDMVWAIHVFPIVLIISF
jgi:O-methyltransferase involved in polyketide biosynthesis